MCGPCVESPLTSPIVPCPEQRHLYQDMSCFLHADATSASANCLLVAVMTRPQSAVVTTMTVHMP